MFLDFQSSSLFVIMKAEQALLLIKNFFIPMEAKTYEDLQFNLKQQDRRCRSFLSHIFTTSESF